MSYNVLEEYRRTKGSRGQKLLKVGSGKSVHDQVQFFLLESCGERFFAKKHEDIKKQQLEQEHLSKVSHRHIIRLHDVSSEYGLIFPYLPYKKLPEVKNVRNGGEIFGEIQETFKYLDTIKIGKKSVLSRIDAHPHNFMVDFSDGVITDWVLIDLEYFKYRNSSHKLKKILGIK